MFFFLKLLRQEHPKPGLECIRMDKEWVVKVGVLDDGETDEVGLEVKCCLLSLCSANFLQKTLFQEIRKVCCQKDERRRKFSMVICETQKDTHFFLVGWDGYCTVVLYLG